MPPSFLSLLGLKQNMDVAAEREPCQRRNDPLEARDLILGLGS
jgi:hypothetical protein